MTSVYFIRSTGFGDVKIGTSADPRARLRDLQTGNAEELSLIRVIDGGEAEERWLHDRFREHRVRGEWFTFRAEMMTVSPPEGLEPVRRNHAQPHQPSHGIGGYLRNAIRLGLMTPEEIAGIDAAGLLAERQVAVAAE